MFFAEFCVVILAMVLGARWGGVFFGMAGGIGLMVLIVAFGLAPASPPINVMLIMMAVVLAASTLQSSGGMAFLVRVAEKLLRKRPQAITFVAPLIAWVFTFMAGTGNVLYSLLPVIAEVSREAGIRPERPISISVIASQHAVPASPISAATAAMVALLSVHGVTVLTILAIVVPATIIGILCGAVSVWKRGKELKDDPEYQKLLAEGAFANATKAKALGSEGGATKQAKASVAIFIAAALIVVLVGTFPELRPMVTNAAGKVSRVSMNHMIQLVMLITGGIIVMTCAAKPAEVIKTPVFRAGMMGVVTVFGLAWMSDTWIANNLPLIKSSVAAAVQGTPWLFAIALFCVGALTHSQGATVAALMPLGLALGIDPLLLVAMYPAVCGYFLIPSTGVLLAGVAFDETGTTKIGRAVINHSYLRPGLVATICATAAGIAIRTLFF
ncbi:MAG: anaerobic C4-dicarboxylate transporter [Sutterellaceae bacterium]|nr:anaerobic C4-dicarboxylate transporter [Sutterellaceae bacterium]MDD7441618.1 anaerobic C4-dicarboxylate transporter [Sutterellaceae bacterium]MDY2868969.1 anaerobic C4-dicarboxylate transporter [Mesosutterella sp.]